MVDANDFCKLETIGSILEDLFNDVVGQELCISDFNEVD